VNGSTYYLGAMHAGTHITHPDVMVDRRGNGLGWQQEEWLEFFVELTVTHARVLGAEALESAAAAAGGVPTKRQVMIPKPRAPLPRRRDRVRGPEGHRNRQFQYQMVFRTPLFIIKNTS